MDGIFGGSGVGWLCRNFVGRSPVRVLLASAGPRILRGQTGALLRRCDRIRTEGVLRGPSFDRPYAYGGGQYLNFGRPYGYGGGQHLNFGRPSYYGPPRSFRRSRGFDFDDDDATATGVATAMTTTINALPATPCLNVACVWEGWRKSHWDANASPRLVGPSPRRGSRTRPAGDAIAHPAPGCIQKMSRMRSNRPVCENPSQVRPVGTTISKDVATLSRPSSVVRSKPRLARRCVQQLFDPIDAASLAVFRIAVGSILLWEVLPTAHGRWIPVATQRCVRMLFRAGRCGAVKSASFTSMPAWPS